MRHKKWPKHRKLTTVSKNIEATSIITRQKSHVYNILHIYFFYAKARSFIILFSIYLFYIAIYMDTLFFGAFFIIF